MQISMLDLVISTFELLFQAGTNKEPTDSTSKNKRNNSKKQLKGTQNDDPNTNERPSGLGVNNNSESNYQNDIENAISLLGAASLAQKGN